MPLNIKNTPELRRRPTSTQVPKFGTEVSLVKVRIPIGWRWLVCGAHLAGRRNVIVAKWTRDGPARPTRPGGEKSRLIGTWSKLLFASNQFTANTAFLNAKYRTFLEQYTSCTQAVFFVKNRSLFFISRKPIAYCLCHMNRDNYNALSDSAGKI